MKKLFIIGFLFLVVFSFVNVSFAAKDEKGASAQALENADDNAVFNRVSDWFATIGKSKEEKEQILTERKAKRAAERMQKRAEKQSKMAEKKIKKRMDESEGQMKEMKNNMKMNKGPQK